MFRLLRFYAVTSLIGVLVAALLLVVFYRQIAVGTIQELGEASNIALSRTLLNSVRPLLVEFLVRLDTENPEVIRDHPMNRLLGQSLASLRAETSVVKIKIYNRRGVVVYSTDPAQIGENQSANWAWQRAIQGHITSKLIYRDSFNAFDGVTEDDNLIQTYQPVRADSGEPVRGVFEIYTDVNHLVRRVEYSEFEILAGVLVVLALLYGLLLLVVHRAAGIIQRQQVAIQRRNRSLELLSAQLIRGQEEEKQRLAGNLHEGIAQTLSAVKIHVESVSRLLAQPDNGVDRQQRLEAVVPVIQQAIQEVRGLAMELRPASLDELGLLPTLRWYCREFQAVYPDVVLDATLAVTEQDIPEPLRIIIYRIIQDTLTRIARGGRVRYIGLHLGAGEQGVTLEVEDDDPESSERVVPMWTPTMRERTQLSGGVYREGRVAEGRLCRRSHWFTTEPVI